MLIYGKNIKNQEKKTFYGQTDRPTDGQPKTIVRNLTKTCHVIDFNYLKSITHLWLQPETNAHFSLIPWRWPGRAAPSSGRCWPGWWRRRRAQRLAAPAAAAACGRARTSRARRGPCPRWRTGAGGRGRRARRTRGRRSWRRRTSWTTARTRSCPGSGPSPAFPRESPKRADTQKNGRLLKVLSCVSFIIL